MATYRIGRSPAAGFGCPAWLGWLLTHLGTLHALAPGDCGEHTRHLAHVARPLVAGAHHAIEQGGELRRRELAAHRTQRRAKAVDVGPDRDDAFAVLFGGHEPRCPKNRRAVIAAITVAGLRIEGPLDVHHHEVGEGRRAIRTHDHVAGFDVAVHCRRAGRTERSSSRSIANARAAGDSLTGAVAVCRPLQRRAGASPREGSEWCFSLSRR